MKLCKPVKVALKDGKVILVRSPKMGDLKKLLDFINSFVDEDAKILVNKKLTLKEEKDWLKTTLENIRSGNEHLVVALYNNQVIANVYVRKGRYRQSHVAEYGIAIRKEYRNKGLGRILSEIILDIARKDRKIKIVELGVFRNNKPAIHLYKRLGFKKAAVLKKRLRYKSGYIDDIVMDLEL
jgi:RimJ/RimL family protein N-acetyltransferase